MNYFKDDKYLCPFYKNLALSYFYQENDISYFQELLNITLMIMKLLDAYFSCLYKQNNLQELKNMKFKNNYLYQSNIILKQKILFIMSLSFLKQ